MSLPSESISTDHTDPLEAGGSSGTSPAAVVSAALALASALTLVHPTGVVFGGLAVTVAFVAYRRLVYTQGDQLSRRLCLGAMALAVCLMAVAGGWHWSRFRKLESDARSLADQFLGFLAQGEVVKAHQLTLKPHNRSRAELASWQLYTADAKMSDDLRILVQQPVVRGLLNLKDRAVTRFVVMDEWLTDGKANTFTLIYAVTFEESGRKKSFFTSVVATRDENGWEIVAVEGPIQPREFATRR